LLDIREVMDKAMSRSVCALPVREPITMLALGTETFEVRWRFLGKLTEVRRQDGVLAGIGAAFLAEGHRLGNVSDPRIHGFAKVVGGHMAGVAKPC